MQSLYNTVKGKALGVAEYLTPVLKESKFLETGVLTPEEFVAAGDHLTHHCPTWKWDAGDPAYARPFLPPNKQFLLTRNVPCYRRVKEMQSEGAEVEISNLSMEGAEGWVETHADSSTREATSLMEEQVQEMTLDDHKETDSRLPAAPAAAAAADPASDEDEDEVYDMEEFDKMGIVQEDDPSEYVAPAAATPVSSSHDCDAGEQKDNIIATRTYDLHITYDKYYQTPRLFLTGYDESRVPLSVDAMYEDFSEDHANKTITMEQHPHVPGTLMASVHPCKHAETMKRICETVSEGGKRLEVHIYLIVFLKFMQAIIPTVEYDFTHNFSL